MTKPESALCGALLLACAAAWAQTAPQPSASASAAEKAQKETDRTMYWIRVLADKPAPTKPATPPKPAAAVAAAPAKPAAEAREKVKVVTAPSPTTTAANAAPARMAVGRGVDPAQGPVADPSEPSALSSNHADHAAATLAPAEATPIPAVEPDPGLTQIKSVRPEFPASIVLRYHKGNVEVQFEVDPGGTVIDATVVASSHKRLNDAALEAVKQWRFKPTSTAHTAVVNLVYDIDHEK